MDKYTYRRTNAGAFDIPAAEKPEVRPSNPELRPTVTEKYYYATNCVSSTAAKIDAMVDRAREVTLRTLARHCPDLAVWCREMLYAVGAEKGLHLKDDWAVRFFKSRFCGKPCYYIQHSCIEYIWTQRQ